jgi:hypothetical protein
VKRTLGPIVIVVGLVLIGAIGLRSVKARTAAAEREADAIRLQRDYLERVGWMRSNPDPKAYTAEVGTFFKSYFARVEEHQQRFGGNREFDDYLAELEKRSKEDRAADRKAFYEYTRKQFDLFRSGKYAPIWSATDKGMRLDVVSSNVVMVAGRPQVRLQLVLWGAQRELKEDGKLKKMVTSASFSSSWRLTDDKGKLLGEMSAGDPSMKIDFPERFIAQFPPQMVIGHYDLDLVPAAVTKMEMAFAVTSRASTGGTAEAAYSWKLDVPSEWKLKDGEKWEGAVESERPEEEIDPAKAQSAAGE